MRKPIVLIAVSLLSFSETKADILQYTFNGVIPDGASQHTQINDGETFTATFLIDTSVRDEDPD